MGTTASGLRYPEPAEPVAQGAVNIANLAADVNARYVQQFTGVAQTATVPANGNVVFIPAVNVPALPWPRVILVDYRGLCTSLAAANYADLMLSNSTGYQSTARTNGPGNPHGLYVGLLPAGQASVWQVNASANAAATFSPNGAFGGMSIICFPVST